MEQRDLSRIAVALEDISDSLKLLTHEYKDIDELVEAKGKRKHIADMMKKKNGIL